MKGGEFIPEFFPDPEDWKDMAEWMKGAACAHADYPDTEAIISILEGDGTGGESFQEALCRVLGPELFDRVKSWITEH